MKSQSEGRDAGWLCLAPGESAGGPVKARSGVRVRLRVAAHLSPAGYKRVPAYVLWGHIFMGIPVPDVCVCWGRDSCVDLNLCRVFLCICARCIPGGFSRAPVSVQFAGGSVREPGCFNAFGPRGRRCPGKTPTLAFIMSVYSLIRFK